MRRRPKGGWGKSWDTLRNAGNVARAQFRKIPNNAVKKRTEWSSLSSECTMTSFIPATSGCSPPSVNQILKLDLVGPNSAGTAVDLINVHHIELAFDAAYAPQDTNQCTTEVDTAIQTLQLRWGMLKYNAKDNPSPDVTFNPFANATNFMTDAKLMLHGQVTKIPTNSATVNYDNSDDCTPQANTFVIGGR